MKDADRHLDVAAIGEAMVEFNQDAAGPDRFRRGLGGDTSNAVIAAARAGARAAYVSRVGDDAFGDTLREAWRAEGVDASAVEFATGEPTGLYFVTHGAAGHAFTYRRAGSAASRMTRAWVDSDAPRRVLARSRWLLVSGISLALSADARDAAFAAIDTARAAGTRIAFDSNLRLKLWTLADARPAIERAIALSDLFLPSLDDITALTGLAAPEAVLDWSRETGARAVVLKCGDAGTWVDDGAARTSTRTHIAPHRVRAIDATGAGDCFAGNLLARIVAGDALVDAARYANAAAALSVQGQGAVSPLPRPDAVRRLLAERSSP